MPSETTGATSPAHGKRGWKMIECKPTQGRRQFSHEARESAVELASATDTEDAHLVAGLFPTGTTLMVGPAKCGKSTLAVQLSCAVAGMGGLFGLKTARGRVVYLNEEMSRADFQRSLWDAGEDIPEGFDIIHQNASKIGAGLLDQLSSYIAERPDTALIVVDTVAAVRPRRRRRSGMQDDYEDLAQLTTFAHDKKISVLLIHHATKRVDERCTPVDAVNGTMGMSASVDCIAAILPTADGQGHVLKVEGRGVGHKEIRLVFEEGHWRPRGPIGDMTRGVRAPSPAALQAIEFVAARGQRWRGSASELVEQAGIAQTNGCKLGIALSKAREYMEQQGIRYEREHSKTGNVYTFSPVAEGEGDSQPPSDPSR